MPVVQKLARAATAALGADGASVYQFNEAAGGQVVFHLHFHVIPRFEGDELKPPGGPWPTSRNSNPRRKIRAALASFVSNCTKNKRGVPGDAPRRFDVTKP